MFVENKRNEKLKRQEELIQNATVSLISNQHNKNNYLYQQFQKSRHLFDSENRIDHVRKRALEKADLKKELPVGASRTSGKTKIINEQRLEILDYYEMNQKLIDKRRESQEENEKLFENIKKLGEMSSQNKKITRGDMNLSTLQRIQTNHQLPINKNTSVNSFSSSFYKTKKLRGLLTNQIPISPIRSIQSNK